MTQLLDRLENWLFVRPGPALLTRPMSYVYALAHDLFRGELTLRAMSLVYTTLMSIVPLLALAFSVLKGLGYHHDLEPVLYQFLEPLGDKAFQLTNQVMQFVENISGGVLGSLGLVFLLYTSVSMIKKIEESFNFVWRVKEPRGFGRRISEYLSALILGPVLLVSTFGLLAALSNTTVVQAIAGIKPFGSMLVWIGKLTPYVLITCIFAFLYGFVPNTKVRLRAALIGGAAAGVAWAMTGVAFATFVGAARGTMLVYAGFAVVILGLIWVYVSWLILLLGAQLAFYVQHPHSLRPGSSVLQLTASLTERLALSTMYLIARSYAQDGGERTTRWSANALAEQLNIAGAALDPVIQRLENARLLVATEDEHLIPGRDLASINLADVLDAVRCDVNDGKLAHIRSIAAADVVANSAAQAMRESVNNKTLKAWIDETKE